MQAVSLLAAVYDRRQFPALTERRYNSHAFRTNNFPGSCLTTRFISRPSNATLTAELGKLLRRMTSSMLDSSLFNAS